MQAETSLLNSPFPDFLPRAVAALNYEPTVDRFVAATEDGRVQVLEGERMRLLREVQLEAELEAVRVFYGLRDCLVVVCSNGSVLVYALNNLLEAAAQSAVDCGGVLNCAYKRQTDAEGSTLYEWLCVGGADGSLHLLSNDSLTGEVADEPPVFVLRSVIPNVGEKSAECLSCDFVPSKNSVFGGYSNGRVKKFDGNRSNAVVWNSKIGSDFGCLSLAAFKDSFVVVGGSAGKVFVLDDKFGVVVRSFAGASIADVTCLAVSERWQSVFWSGFDSRVFCLKFDAHDNDFKLAGRNRGQTHEVNALAIRGDRLVSAGKTSDFCLFKIGQSGFLEAEEEPKRHVQQTVTGFESAFQNGHFAYCYSGELNVIRLNSGTSVEKLFRLLPRDKATCYAFADSTATLAVSFWAAKLVKLYDVETGKVQKEMSLSCSRMALAGHKVFMYGDRDHGLAIVDCETLKVGRVGPLLDVYRALGAQVDSFEVSASKNVAFVAKYLEKRLFLIDLKTSKATDASFVLKDGGVSKVGFFGRSEKLFYVKESEVGLLHHKRLSINKLKLKVPNGVNLSAFNNVLFMQGDADKALFWDAYSLLLVNFGSGVVKRVRQSAPALALGQLSEDVLFRLTIDWKAAAMHLAAPVYTKRYVTN